MSDYRGQEAPQAGSTTGAGASSEPGLSPLRALTETQRKNQTRIRKRQARAQAWGSTKGAGAAAGGVMRPYGSLLPWALPYQNPRKQKPRSCATPSPPSPLCLLGHFFFFLFRGWWLPFVRVARMAPSGSMAWDLSQGLLFILIDQSKKNAKFNILFFLSFQNFRISTTNNFL